MSWAKVLLVILGVSSFSVFFSSQSAHTTTITGASRRWTDTANLLVGVDERVEVLMLARNLLGWEDSKGLGPPQIHPIREEVRSRFTSFRLHTFLSYCEKLEEEGITLPDFRLALSVSPWPECSPLDPAHSIAESLKRQSPAFYGEFSEERLTQAVSEWLSLFQQFWRDTRFHDYYLEHAADYQGINKSVREILSSLPFDELACSGETPNGNSVYRFIPSPLAKPGRNWSITFSTGNEQKTQQYHIFGPYKKVPLAIFATEGFEDAPIGFDDSYQFAVYGLHEYLHSMLLPVFQDKRLRFILADNNPGSHDFQNVLGLSYGRTQWPKFFEESLVRAIVNRYIRETHGNLRAELDLRMNDRTGNGLVRTLSGHLECIPTNKTSKMLFTPDSVIALASDPDVHANIVTDVNQWTLGLGSFLNSFVPRFANESNTKLLLVGSDIFEDRRADALQTLGQRIFPNKAADFGRKVFASSAEELTAQDFFVFYYSDVGDDSPLRSRILKYLGVEQMGNLVVRSDGTSYEADNLALISYTPNPSVVNGVIVSFICFGQGLKPTDVIPVWCEDFDAAFVMNGSVLRAWTIDKMSARRILGL